MRLADFILCLIPCAALAADPPPPLTRSVLTTNVPAFGSSGQGLFRTPSSPYVGFSNLPVSAGQNVGAFGSGLFGGTVGGTMNFRNIWGLNGISVSTNGNLLTIDGPGSSTEIMFDWEYANGAGQDNDTNIVDHAMYADQAAFSTNFTDYGNMTIHGNVWTKGPVFATNGIVYQGASSTIANLTITTNSTQLWLLNGTNQIVTLPDCTKIQPYQIYRFSSTNGHGSFTITNATGTQTIRDGTSLSYFASGVASVAFYTDGSVWILASKAKTIWPNASWSTSTNVPFAVATSNHITFDTLETSNGQGITLTNGYQIYVRDPGQYMLTFSLVMQVGHNNDTNRVWLQQSGINIPRTRTDTKMPNTTEQMVMTVNFVLPVVTNLTWFGVCLRSTDTGAQLVTGAPASAIMPAMPSAIVTVNKISDTPP